MRLPVYKRDGTESGESVEIPDEILERDPNDHAIWLAVRSEEAAARQGTHSTKSRSHVRGGGRKPFKQKGRGVARQGTRRSPLHPGGGIIFGPHPHAYSVKVPKKVKSLARRSAFVYKARADKVRVVEDFTLERPRTKEMAVIFQALGLMEEKVLFLTGEESGVLAKSIRNIPGVISGRADFASTRQLMDCTTIVLQKSAVDKLVKVLNHAA